MSTKTKSKANGNWLERWMGRVERVGNLLPHPFWLFGMLGVITVVLSAVLSAIGWSATYETVVDGVLTPTTVTVVNQMTFDRLAYYMTNFIKTGNPNGLDIDGTPLPEWKTYTKEHNSGIVFGKENCYGEDNSDSAYVDFLIEEIRDQLKK